MKICCFGDIHFYYSREDLEKPIKGIRGRCKGGGVLVIVGDISGNGNLGFTYTLLSII